MNASCCDPQEPLDSCQLLEIDENFAIDTKVFSILYKYLGKTAGNSILKNYLQKIANCNCCR